jgi:hypothetical protein
MPRRWDLIITAVAFLMVVVWPRKTRWGKPINHSELWLWHLSIAGGGRTCRASIGGTSATLSSAWWCCSISLPLPFTASKRVVEYPSYGREEAHEQKSYPGTFYLPMMAGMRSHGHGMFMVLPIKEPTCLRAPISRHNICFDSLQ